MAERNAILVRGLEESSGGLGGDTFAAAALLRPGPSLLRMLKGAEG